LAHVGEVHGLDQVFEARHRVTRPSPAAPRARRAFFREQEPPCIALGETSHDLAVTVVPVMPASRVGCSTWRRFGKRTRRQPNLCSLAPLPIRSEACRAAGGESLYQPQPVAPSPHRGGHAGRGATLHDPVLGHRKIELPPVAAPALRHTKSTARPLFAARKSIGAQLPFEQARQARRRVTESPSCCEAVHIAAIVLAPCRPLSRTTLAKPDRNDRP
jgi:hypothetical protein